MPRWDRIAPSLLGPNQSAGRWPWQRAWDRWIERAITRRLDEERVREWHRIAPGGTPLWVLPDQDLENMIDQLASSSRARTVAITYYLAEYDRRQARRMNEVVAEANRSMVRLTRAIVALTVLVVILTAVAVVLAA